MSDSLNEKNQTDNSSRPSEALGGSGAHPSDGDAHAQGVGSPAEVRDGTGNEAPAGMTQADIARRVESLTKDEEEVERIAREEEAKLAARRAGQKKDKKSGLEVAASKRLARIGEKGSVRRSAGATPSESNALADRSLDVSRWIEKNSQSLGLVVGLALAGSLSVAGYNYYQQRKESDASAALSLAVADQKGRLGDPEKEKDADRLPDPTPVFKTAEERAEAALRGFRGVAGKFPSTGPGTMARLAEGSLLLDKKDAEGAIKSFEEVKASPLAKADKDVLGRALEGLGFAWEIKAASDATAFDKAIAIYKELEAVDSLDFRWLAMYHQARCYEAKGDAGKAKELLKAVYDQANKPGENHPYPYLEQLSEERLRALDPAALPPKNPGQLSMGPGGAKSMNEEQIKRLIEQMQKKGGGEHP